MGNLVSRLCAAGVLAWTMVSAARTYDTLWAITPGLLGPFETMARGQPAVDLDRFTPLEPLLALLVFEAMRWGVVVGPLLVSRWALPTVPSGLTSGSPGRSSRVAERILVSAIVLAGVLGALRHLV